MFLVYGLLCILVVLIYERLVKFNIIGSNIYVFRGSVLVGFIGGLLVLLFIPSILYKIITISIISILFGIILYGIRKK